MLRLSSFYKLPPGDSTTHKEAGPLICNSTSIHTGALRRHFYSKHAQQRGWTLQWSHFGGAWVESRCAVYTLVWLSNIQKNVLLNLLLDDMSWWTKTPPVCIIIFSSISFSFHLWHLLPNLWTCRGSHPSQFSAKFSSHVILDQSQASRPWWLQASILFKWVKFPPSLIQFSNFQYSSWRLLCLEMEEEAAAKRWGSWPQCPQRRGWWGLPSRRHLWARIPSPSHDRGPEVFFTEEGWSMHLKCWECMSLS